MSQVASDVWLKRDARGIDWTYVKEMYRISSFDNGRSAKLLRRCFEQSQTVCFAMIGSQLVGTARAISDRCSCAAIFDVCVHPDYRSQGIGRAMVRSLLADLTGQYVLLTTSIPEFYAPLGFRREANAMWGLPQRGLGHE